MKVCNFVKLFCLILFINISQLSLLIYSLSFESFPFIRDISFLTLGSNFSSSTLKDSVNLISLLLLDDDDYEGKITKFPSFFLNLP